MGSAGSKAALGATTDEPTKPEPKHLDDLVRYINETNLSVVRIADILSEQTKSSNWVVVFKALVTVHHLTVHGNERFLQHLASRSSLFTLQNFLDQNVIEGYNMSIFIRRYSRYLNEKSLACRLISFDITKTKRGINGTMRTMNTKDLLNTLPVIQTQFDALLNFNANPDEITNDIIRAAFLLLFKDSLRLFEVYNDGILNLLDKYFDMRKNQCKESLDIYIKFLGRKSKLAEFLKVAQAPHSLLEALQHHLDSMEVKINPSPIHKMGHLSSALFSSQNAAVTTSPHTDSLADLNLGKMPAKGFYMNQPLETESNAGMNCQLNTNTCTPATGNLSSDPSAPYMVLPSVTYPLICERVPMYRMVPSPMGAPYRMASEPTVCTQLYLRTTYSSCSPPGYSSSADELESPVPGCLIEFEY